MKLQLGVFGVTSLFISYNIKEKFVCMCVAASEEIDIDIFTTHLLTPWIWNDWVSFLRDFKPLVDLDLYGEHMPEERITGSKIDLDISVRSTYARVCMVMIITKFEILILCNTFLPQNDYLKSKH